MRNGNLEDKLQNAATSLSLEERITCSVKIAEGLVFLHNQPKPLIHRDIKTSNILLDNNMLPKVDLRIV